MQLPEREARQPTHGLGHVPLAGKAGPQPIADLEPTRIPVDGMEAARADERAGRRSEVQLVAQVLAQQEPGTRLPHVLLVALGGRRVLRPGQPWTQLWKGF